MFQTFFLLFSIKLVAHQTVFVQPPSLSSVQGCISEVSERNGAYSFAPYKTWGTEVNVLSTKGAQRIRQILSDYSTATIYIQCRNNSVQPISVSFLYCPFLIILLFAVEKVSVHVLMLYKKCSNLAIVVFSVHAGLRKREVQYALNQGENKLTACSESKCWELFILSTEYSISLVKASNFVYLFHAL